MIERALAGAAASASNFGNLRLQGRHPAEFPLALRAQAIWEDLPRLSGEACGARCLRARLSGPRAGRAGEAGARPRARPCAAGLDVELLMGPAARRRWPHAFKPGERRLLVEARRRGRAGARHPIVARLASRRRASYRTHEGCSALSVPAAAGFAVSTERGAHVSCGPPHQRGRGLGRGDRGGAAASRYPSSPPAHRSSRWAAKPLLRPLPPCR